MTTIRGLSNGDVLRRLRILHRDRKRGALVVASDEASRELFFDDGVVIGVRTTVTAERLGELLIRLGRITRQHFEDASIFVRHGWRLGEILATLGIIDRADIDRFVRLQALDVASRALDDPRAEARFDENAELFATLSTPLSAPAIVLEACRRIPQIEPIRRAVAGENRRFRPASLEAIAECSDLTPEDGYVISRFQEGARLGEVVGVSGLEEEPALRTLFGLVQSGILVPEIGPGSESADRELAAFEEEVDRMSKRLARLDPWRALDLPPDVGIETAHAAFRDALRRYHPDRHHAAADVELRKKLTGICQAFTDAHTSLTTALRLRRARAEESAIPLASTLAPTDPPADSATRAPAPAAAAAPREAPAGSAPKGDPRVYLREGKRALAAEDYWRAIQLLKRANSLGEDGFEVHFLLGEALSKNPRWRRDAERSYRRALEVEPWRRDVYASLGKLYEAAGLTHRAERCLEKSQEAVTLEGTPEPSAAVSGVVCAS